MEHEEPIPLPTSPSQAAAFVAAVKAQAEHHAHSDDPAMAREHAAVLDLVDRAEATHVAIANGDWFDPATWFQGRIPGAGARVLIPEAATVTYDGQSNASLRTVRVDGELNFATDSNTRMVVDTLVVAPSGRLEIGTEADPIEAGVRAEIAIANNGAINTAWDPMLFSRGIVSHGAVEIHGAEKTSFLKVAVDPMAGDRTITLAEAPEGWRVGDTIVLTGTEKAGWVWSNSAGREVRAASQDEEVTITAINGNRLTINRALTYDHDTPRDDLDAYVSNMTRNVTIHSQNGAATPVSQRGHVMLMHSDDIDVRYAAFDDLGRTDKSREAWDVGALSNVTATSNVKGRYSLHLHKTGLDDQDSPAMVVGNAVSGSPGWGFAHHSSNAVFADNAAYDVFGAAYAAEDGDETGAWLRNIAIDSAGISYGEAMVKEQGDVDRHDNGRTGEGFFFAGRLVEAAGNVAANTTHGYVWMTRGSPKNPDSDTMDHPEIAYGKGQMRVDQAPIQGFHDNEAFGTEVGLIVVKADPGQGHDVRTVMDGFLNWETAAGMDIAYTAHYTIRNIDLIASDSGDYTPYGVAFGGNSHDIVFNGLRIRGFETGVDFTQNIFSYPVVDRDVADVLIDVSMSDVGRAYAGFNAARHRVMTSSQLVDGRLSTTRPADATLSWGEDLYLNGIKTDSIGARDRQFPSVGDYQALYWGEHVQPLLRQEGYYVTADNRRVLVLEDFVADRATGALLKFAHAITLDMTTAQLASIGATNNGRIALGGQAPVTAADRTSTAEDTPVSISVLANDRDPDGGTLRVDGFVQPENGRVFAAADGRSLLYVPDLDFTGTDRFTYWAGDGSGNFTPASVAVEVRAGGGGGGTPIGLTLTGGAAAETLTGAAGPDLLRGMGGNDRLYGEAGADRLEGGAGWDRLYGGAGNDRLVGGADVDRFIFSGGDGRDVIEDFARGVDRIIFGDAAAESRADLTITRSGTSTLIAHDGGVIEVLNTTPADFAAENIFFL